MKTLSKKIDSDRWHIYNVDTKKHIVVGSDEKKLLDNKDEDFFNFLKKNDFNEKEKHNIWDLKFPILRTSVVKNYFTILLEKIILTISFVLFLLFIIWTSIFKFSFSIHYEMNFFEYYFITIISIFLHEMFHYIFLINRNVMVPEVGFRMRFLVPIFSMYVDSTGMSFIKKRGKMETYFSGLLAHVNIFLIFYYLNIVFKSKILYEISTINLFLLLFNSLWIWNQDGKQIIKIFLGVQIKPSWSKLFYAIYSIMILFLFFEIKG